jgi:hypothetical protein
MVTAKKDKEKEKETDTGAGGDQPVPVKRGRKPKAVYNSYDMMPCSSDDEHIIMKLNVGAEVIDGSRNNKIDEPGAYNSAFDVNFFQLDETSGGGAGAGTDLVGGAGAGAGSGVGTGAAGDAHDPRSLKVVELLKDFEEKNKNNEWPQSTSIHCYWCCHKFDTPPFGIPVKYTSAGKFQVYGCFCSLECASAYNFDAKDGGHDDIWERNTLINFIAKKIGYEKNVKPAPSRLALHMFGGHLAIQDFREYCKTSKLININFPPMMTITQQIEEVNESDVSSDFKYIPVDTDRINKYKEKIHLRRTKPVNAHEHTLDHAMNLRFGVA